MNNVDKFNKMGITDNTINMLDHFNDKVEPKTEEEKVKEQEEPKEKEESKDKEEPKEKEGENKNEIIEKKEAEKEKEKEKEKPKEETEDLTPEEMIRQIMQNCAGTLDQITVPPESNEYLANKTTYLDTMNKTLKNDKNDKNYTETSLHS